FDLSEAGGRLAKTYSGGMRRRLDIAASLVVTPDLVFLDEPTAGLDPRSRNQVWDIVRALTAGGTTVLLTTQYLEEADQLAARIAVIDLGKVIAEGTSAELKASVGSGVLQVRLRDPEHREGAAALLAERLAAQPHFASDPAALTVACPDPARAVAVIGDLAAAGMAVDGFSLGQPTLDEVFFALTGHAAEPQDESASDEKKKGKAE